MLAISALVPTYSARSEEPSVAVGLIWPGETRVIGRAYRHTVAMAIAQVGSIRVGENRSVPIRLIPVVDNGDPATAVTAARELVARGVVAILGPVDSASTKAVVAAQLGVPILSSTSTAESLTSPRNDWFFRATLNDGERLRRYLDGLRRENVPIDSPVVVIYDDRIPEYASGLAAQLELALDGGVTERISWSELVGDNLNNMAGRKRVRLGEGFHREAVEKLDPMPRSVFVFGTSAYAGLIAQGVANWTGRRDERPPTFFFVGYDSELRASAPNGSFTIGDPTVLGGPGTEVDRLRGSFASLSREDREDFVVTAYETARFILPAAIKSAIENTHQGQAERGQVFEIPPIELVRERLRRELEDGEFSSIEPWRRTRLSGGRFDNAPSSPIYRIESQFKVLSVPDPAPYWQIDAPADVGLFEGPVVVRVSPHNSGAEAEAELSLRGDSTSKFLQTFRGSSDAFDLSFYPLQPGEYELLPTVGSAPHRPRIRVGITMSYFAAFFAGLFGSLFIANRKSIGRLALGALTGVALAALHFHRASLPFAIPIPQFGTTPLEAAIWAGLFGGLAGPSVFLAVFGRFIPGLAGGDKDTDKPDARPGDEPPAKLSRSEPLASNVLE